MSDAPPGPKAVTAAELKAQTETERLGRPFVVYRDASGEQAIVALPTNATGIWIGRSPSADVHLAWDAEVSSLHAQVEVVRDECTLVDEGISRNGSCVNGERVSGRRLLRDGDMIRVGQTLVLFRNPASAVAESTALSGDALTAAGVSPGQKRVLVALCRPFKEDAPSPPPRPISRSPTSSPSRSTRSRPTSAPSSRSRRGGAAAKPETRRAGRARAPERLGERARPVGR